MVKAGRFESCGVGLEDKVVLEVRGGVFDDDDDDVVVDSGLEVV